MKSKKLKIEYLTHMFQDQTKRFWYAIDYSKPSYVPDIGMGYVCYMILDANGTPLELNEKFHGEEMNIVLDNEGYAYIPAFLNKTYN